MSSVKKNNLQSLRKAKGWQQADVAEFMGLTALTICRHETHVSDIKPTVLQKYSRLYGADVDEIYRDIEEG